MKTVQQIMQETGAKANIRNFRYMQENYTYKQKIRHAENVARSYQDKCSEMGLNCHVSVGGLDSSPCITSLKRAAYMFPVSVVLP